MKRRRFTSSLVGLGLAVGLAAGLAGRSAAAPPDMRTTESNVTRLTTNLLEHSQLAHRPFDARLAKTLLDRYLDALDGSRSLFLQADVDEFASHSADLARATHAGDTSMAQVIFARYLERLEQRTTYVADRLRTSAFDFTGHDTYSFDREHAARPRDLQAAQALWGQQLRVEYLQQKLEDRRPEQIVETLARRHAQQLRTIQNLRGDEVLDTYLDALAHVYDPHSDYLGHEQMESFSIAMNLSLYGVGATLEGTDGDCKVRELIPGGPAAKSGLLRPGDRIVGVAQAGQEPVDVVSMPLSRAVELIRGPKGSTVTLKVLPAGAPDGSPAKTVSLVRDEIKLEDQEAKARIVDLPSGKGTVRLGIIDLPSFYSDMGSGMGARAGRSATADVARLLGKLKAEHVQGVVLDLRRNGGGSLMEAITLTGLFIGKGPVVQTRDQTGGEIEVGADTDPAVLYDGPLVLLTSRLSASASEILAGALQDYGRALIVGDSTTYGKGTVQNVLPLGRLMDRMGLAHSYDPGALKVSISKFYRPSGASTQLRGVVSDIVLPSTTDFADVGESSMKDALPWDRIPPASYEPLNRVAPYVEVLRQRSARRVAAEEDFGDLEADVARVKQRVATKSVSLNEATRREELAEDKARREARKRREQTSEATRPAMYAITLENVSSPGLPPRVALTKDGGKASPTVSSSASDLDDPPMNPPPGGDIVLNESEQILADYVELVTQDSAASELPSAHPESGILQVVVSQNTTDLAR